MTHATYLPRSAWRARAPKGGPGALTPSRVQGAVVHWPGSSSKTPITSREAVASALRGWQNFHMDDREWSDIAYQVAVDQVGRVWDLRGLRTQSGANGNADLNETYGAILLVLIAGEQPTEAMKSSVRNVVRDFRDLYGQDAALIKPHSAVRPDGTDCPGPAARAAIARGDFEPMSDEAPPNQEDDLSGISAKEIGDAVAGALAPKLDAIEQKYTVADNNYDSQRAAYEATAQAYAGFRIQHLAVDGTVSAAELATVKDEVWSFLRPLWAK
jgi:N-acetylmuramoyl-L-alanine amidase